MEQNISESTNLKDDNLDCITKLQDILAIVFHEIKFTGNIFLVDKNYAEDKQYSQSSIIKVNEAWLKLYDEYFEKTDDTRFKKDLKDKDKTLGLLLKIKFISDVVKLLEYLEDNKDYVPSEVYINTISSLGNDLKRVERYIKFDSTKPLKPQIERIKSVLGGLETRYELLFKNDLEVEDKDIQLYYDIKAEIELTLDRNLPDIMNMLQWISYEKQYKRKIESAKQQHTRKGASRRNR